MSISLKSLVAIRMNEIFPCLACYCQELKFFVRKSRQIQTLALWKEAVKMKLEQFFLKWYLRSFWSVLFCDKSSRSQMFFKVGVLKNYAIFTGKDRCWKKKLQRRCFRVNITKILRTAFFIEHIRCLLLLRSFTNNYIAH